MRSRRLTVKVGTQVVLGPDGQPAYSRLFGFLESIARLRSQGMQVLLVSSGAVGLGSQRLGLEVKPRRLAEKQACAAVGQGHLMALYQDALARVGLIGAQVLLTEYDFSNRQRYLNLRATLEHLLARGVVPIINENDTVSTDELETKLPFRAAPVFGDNDKLSALVASGLEADLLLILSDVEGLYTANPRKDPGAVLVPWVEDLTPEIAALADGQSERGRGGMASKLSAVRVATQAGVRVVIASGLSPDILDRVLSGQPTGTLFEARRSLWGKKRWIAQASRPAGRLRVNHGAREAVLHGGASLLAAGVTAVEGDFVQEDVVAIADEQGREFARGVVLRSRAALDVRSSEPGSQGPVVHRNTLVLLERP